MTTSLFAGFTYGFRSIGFPHELEGLKLMQSSRGDWKRLIPAMIGATAVGIVLSWAVHLWSSYHFGLGTGRMHQYWDWYTNYLWSQTAQKIAVKEGLQYGRIALVFAGIAFYFIMIDEGR